MHHSAASYQKERNENEEMNENQVITDPISCYTWGGYKKHILPIYHILHYQIINNHFSPNKPFIIIYHR